MAGYAKSQPIAIVKGWILSLGVKTLLVGVGAVLIGVASLGFAERLWSQTLQVEGTMCTDEMNVEFKRAYTDDDGTIDNPDHDPGDDGIDPGYEKAVAECNAWINAKGDVEVALGNGYPSYTCTFWVKIKNVGSRKLRRQVPVIDAPDVLTVLEVDPASACGVLSVGESEIESFTVHIEQAAKELTGYSFTIAKRFTEVSGGTIGFWKNWDSHKTFTQIEIEGWLAIIEDESLWFDDLDSIEDMEQILNRAGGKKSTAKSRFLAQYLATHLNNLSGIFCIDGEHNVKKVDGYQYLGLGDPKHAILTEIINAIEAKFGEVEEKWQYNAMKDVCDALNNLDI